MLPILNIGIYYLVAAYFCAVTAARFEITGLRFDLVVFVAAEMKLKIVVAGPKGSGKTLISNCIAGQSDKLTTETYNPTAGVRILEHELQLNGVHEVIQVELWDASGDQK